MKLHTFSVRTKLTAGFGLLAALLLVVAVFAVLRMQEENQRFANYVQVDEARVGLARQVLEATQRRAIAARNLVIIKDQAQAQTEIRDVQTAHQDVRARLAELKTLVLHGENTAEPAAMTLFTEIERVEARYGPVALRIVELLSSGQRAAGIEQMDAECRPLLAALTRASEKFIEFGVNRRNTEREDAIQHFQASRRDLLIMAILCSVLAVGLVVFTTRSILHSLGAEPAELGRVADRIADGDLAHAFSGGALREGSVMHAMERMRESLIRIVTEVRAASHSIATASREIAQGHLDLSSRTEQQAAALEQTAASMSELGQTVNQNADSARQANQLSMGAARVANEGGDVVIQVVQTMKEIDESSNRIASIIAVIDGIAFQTNILALNAAVEAARAGEQGRGFAVVAGEVRNLAQRSAGAAKEIKELIKDSLQRAGRGAELADRAGTTMTEIVTSIQRVADLMGEISAASQEQSTGVAQVGQAVSSMDQSTQQNAALVEQGAAAAESLRDQAQRMVQLVSSFTVQAHASQNTEPAQVPRPKPLSGAAPRQPSFARTLLPSPPNLAPEQGWSQF